MKRLLKRWDLIRDAKLALSLGEFEECIRLLQEAEKVKNGKETPRMENTEEPG